MNEEETVHSARSEWISFGILVAVLVIVMLVVAVSRPLIFGRIVPAVMGEGQPTVSEPAPEVENVPAAEGEGEGDSTSTDTNEPDSQSEEASPDDASSSEETSSDATDAMDESSSDESEETAPEVAPEVAPEEEAPEPAPADAETEVVDESSDDVPAADQSADNNFPYTVRQGDTLYEIARSFGTTPEAIIAATEGLNSLDDVITPGMEIVIPRR